MDPILLYRANIVATVTRAEDLDFLSSPEFGQHAAKFSFDVLEFRLDNLAAHLERSLQVIGSCRERFAILTTVRRPDEGGAGNPSDAERSALYHRFLDLSSLIDIEGRSLAAPAMQETALAAREKGVKVVVSRHDFATFPGHAALGDFIGAAFEKRADVAKIAVYLDKFKDLHTLTSLVEAETARGRPISAMGMGPLGKLSRLVLAKAGSCLNYGYLLKENAPGQWPAQRLSELIREL